MFCTYSGYKFLVVFVGYVICKYFPPFHSLCFHSLNVIHRAQVFNFDEIQFDFFPFMDPVFAVLFLRALRECEIMKIFS